ncbi:MAG: hypothetical protein JWO30_3217 [Fibrobacteres bacterium]|nr:hypothetical protein [Fibrobacterota bacterium]
MDIAMLRIRFWIVSLMVMVACSGTRNGEEGARLDPDKEKLIDVLTLFVESVQGDRFDKAMDYLTLEEKTKMTNASGQVEPPVQKQLKAVRLSTLANKPGVHLEKGKLTGIYAWLPNMNRIPPGETNRDSGPPLIQ